MESLEAKPFIAQTETAGTPRLVRTETAAVRVGLAPATMEKLRCVGGGPPYFKVSSRRVMYDLAELDAWARSKHFDSTSNEGGRNPTMSSDRRATPQHPADTR